MQDYLNYLLTPLLSIPDKLEVSIQTGSISLRVSPVDTGRIIGKNGHVINSLRVLLKTYCHLHQLPITTLTLLAPPLASKTSPD